jgi:hypothetical protein
VELQDKAVRLLIVARKYEEAIDMCYRESIALTEDMAERMTIAKNEDGNDDYRNQILEKIGDCCAAQVSRDYVARSRCLRHIACYCVTCSIHDGVYGVALCAATSCVLVPIAGELCTGNQEVHTSWCSRQGHEVFAEGWRRGEDHSFRIKVGIMITALVWCMQHSWWASVQLAGLCRVCAHVVKCIADLLCGCVLCIGHR